MVDPTLRGDGAARRGAADVDGVALDPPTSPSGGDCSGSGRPVVDGDQEFLVPVGRGESPGRNPPHETTSGASVKVGINAAVCSGKDS